MNKIYLVFFSLLSLLSSCKKDKPDAFADLLASKTWELYDAQVPNIIYPIFLFGDYKFSAGGQFEYTEINGKVYKGTWSHHFHEDTRKQILHIQVVDPITGQESEAVFDHVEFYDHRRFKAYVYTGFVENVYLFQEKR